jgi:hypothetical protein
VTDNGSQVYRQVGRQVLFCQEQSRGAHLSRWAGPVTRSGHDGNAVPTGAPTYP